MGTFAGSSSFSRPGEIETRSEAVVGRSPKIRRRRQRLPRSAEGSEHAHSCRRARCMGHAFSLLPLFPYLRPPGLNGGGASLPGDKGTYTGDRQLQLF